MEQSVINSQTQKALFRKIDALNRLKLSNDRVQGDINENKNYFINGALEPTSESDVTNPIEQQLYRDCFAKVSVAVPVKNKNKTNGDTNSEYVTIPTSISSYLNESIDENNNITDVSFKKEPITFSQTHEEKDGDKDNRFRGHTGVTKIAVSQKEYYTYEYTIDWVCPDPIYFEETFEPNFLKMGAFCSIEFGWAVQNNELPAMTIEEMVRILREKNYIQKRTEKGRGDYYCGVGKVIKYDWKVQQDGSYVGNIKLLSPGSSAFLSTTQGTDNQSQEIPQLETTIDRKKFLDRVRSGERVSESLRNDVEEAFRQDEVNSDQLLKNSVSFQSVVKNLDDVIDKYLESDAKNLNNPNYFNSSLSEDLNPYNVQKQGFDFLRGIGRYRLTQSGLFKDGAMRIGKATIYQVAGTGNQNNDQLATKFDLDEVPEKLSKDRYFVSWGWFEDIILNSFFALDGKINNEQVELQRVQSVLNKQLEPAGPEEQFPTFCNTTEFMYHMGLDSVMLPGKSHPILLNGFNTITDKETSLKILSAYSDKARNALLRTYIYHRAIDILFKPFEDIKAEKGKLGRGVIRNMVFPIEMIQNHFGNMTSLRNGLRSFWADVSGKYGGFWQFKFFQDTKNQNRVGVMDNYYSDVNDPSKVDNKSTKEDIANPVWAGTPKDKHFEFEVYSKNSIVKSFDMNLNLSAEQATISAVGSRKQSSTVNSPNEIPIEAYNILNQITGNDDKLYLGDFERLQERESVQDISIPIEKNFGRLKNYLTSYDKENPTSFRATDDEGINVFKIESILEDFEKDFEKVNTEIPQFVKGIGLYEKNGNLSQYFINVMNYLNTRSKENPTSLIRTAKIPIPITIDMSLDGIAGLQPFDIFRVDYLPPIYRNSCYFVITKVDHDVSNSGWTTNISAIMNCDMKALSEIKNFSINKDLENLGKLFELDRLDVGTLSKLQLIQDNSAEFGKRVDGVAEFRNRFETKKFDWGEIKRENDIQDTDNFFIKKYKEYKAITGVFGIQNSLITLRKDIEEEIKYFTTMTEIFPDKCTESINFFNKILTDIENLN